MKRLTTKQAFITLALAAIATTSTGAFAAQAARDRGPAPSGAAFAACEDRRLGDRVSVKTSSGKMLKGTCKTYRGELYAKTHIRQKKEKSLWRKFASWF